MRWRKIKKISDSIKSSKFSEILDAIENIGEVESVAALLVQDSLSSDADLFSLHVPLLLKNEWSGKSIEFTLEKDLPVKLVNGRDESLLGKARFRVINVPRVRLKNGKEQNMWSLKRYLARSPQLRFLLDTLAASDREEALEYILGRLLELELALSGRKELSFQDAESVMLKCSLFYKFQVLGFRDVSISIYMSPKSIFLAVANIQLN